MDNLWRIHLSSSSQSKNLRCSPGLFAESPPLGPRRQRRAQGKGHVPRWRSGWNTRAVPVEIEPKDWGNLWKSWEIVGKSMKIHEKSMKIVGNLRKTWGNWWENCVRKLWDTSEQGSVFVLQNVSKNAKKQWNMFVFWGGFVIFGGGSKLWRLSRRWFMLGADQVQNEKSW